jgi:hypothetical protein
MAMIAHREQSSVRGKSTTEEVVGLVLLLFSITVVSLTIGKAVQAEKLIYGLSRQDTKRYHSEINESHPRIRATLN